MKSTMRVLSTLLLFLISASVAFGVYAADDDATGEQTGTGVCSSSSSAAAAAAVGNEGECSEPLLSEPTNNNANVSPINDAGYDDDKEEEEEEEEEGNDEFQFECIDEDENCPTYAESGACTDNPGYMTYHCAVSCNTCQAVMDAQRAAQFVAEGTNSKPCTDDHYSCLEWAGMGECDNNPL